MKATPDRYRNGASGRQWVTIVFRNTSRTVCVLKGRPDVVAHAPGRPDVVGTKRQIFFPSPGPPANLAPGSSALLILEASSFCSDDPDHGGQSKKYRKFTIDLPGGGTVETVKHGRAVDWKCGMGIAAFAVPRPEPRYPHDPLTDLRATLHLPASVRAGGVLQYVVELRNAGRRPVTFDRCPGYLQYGDRTLQIKSGYALNCASAREIRAGTSVRFRMRAQIPRDTPPGDHEVFWTFLALDKGTSARVTVRAP